MTSVRFVFLLVGIALIGVALVGFLSPAEPKEGFQDLAIAGTPSAPGETEVPDVTVPPTVTATPVAPTAMPATSVPEPSGTTHIVRRGETLTSIARLYALKSSSIALASGITDPNRIFVGQRLVIPGRVPVRRVHVVQPRESLYCIGRAYGVSPDAIARHNGLPRNARLWIGQVLEIPDSTGWSYVPGETCPPQFSVPPFSPPVGTIYPTSVPGCGGTTGSSTDTGSGSGGSSSATGLASPTPTPSVETRTVEVKGPKEMSLGASDEVILTFKPQPAVPMAPTPTPSTETPEPSETLKVSEPLGVPNVFDHCQIFAIARLDAVGFDVSPLTDTRFPVSEGVPLSWRWSIKPLEAERQRFIVSLRLDFEPTGPQPCHAEIQLWSDSFDVKVTKTIFKLSSSFENSVVMVLGLASTAIGLVGDIRPLLTRKKPEPKEGEAPDKEESKNGDTPDKKESQNG